MQRITLPIDRLQAHPMNPNTMPDLLLKKLVAHLKRTGFYPPVIVRPIEHGRYEILDGHHRVLALRQLGHEQVHCEAWPVDDAEALTLLATLNRLHGEDNVERKAALLEALDEAVGREALLERLPETRDKAERLLSLNVPAPPIATPTPEHEMPVSVHFFLKPAQRLALENKLKSVGGTREQALMQLAGVADDG